MLIAGIIGQNGISETAGLVNSILLSTGKRISSVDSKNLQGLDSKRMKGYLLELVKNNVDILILKINFENINEEIFDSIHFDVIIYTDKADDLMEEGIMGHRLLMKRVISLLDERGVAIVNADDSELIKCLHAMKHHVVTYGFNSEASITTSSVGDIIFEDNFICSLQKSIWAKNGLLIEPQEYLVKADAKGKDSYNLLAAVTFAIVSGVDLNAIGPEEFKNQ